MTMPEIYRDLAESLPLSSSEWDEETQTLVLTTTLYYPGTDEEVMVFVSENAETEGWSVDDGASAAALLEEAGIRPDSPAITAYLQTAYEEVLLMDEDRNFGIPVLDPTDLQQAVREVATGSMMLYAVGRFGGEKV